MEPLFFGRSDSPLYGVYHPADDSATFQNRAIVLCYPAGHEYMRIHRAYRQLASMLNAKGFPVLRFDYFGTGDSAGDQEEISLSRWEEDLEFAVDELQSLAGCKAVDVVALRLGALVACRVASTNKHIKRLFLWEPILEGEAFVSEMQAHIEQEGETLANFWDEGSDTLHFHGYNFPKIVLNGLSSSSFSEITWSRQPQTFCQSAKPEPAFSALMTALSESLSELRGQHIPGLSDWNKLDAVGGIFLPLEDLHHLVACAAGEGEQ